MKLLNHIEEGVLIITFPLMTIITLMGTAVRYLQLGSLTWSEEAARYLMIIAAMAGISYGFREDSHLGLSFFMERLPRSVQPLFRAVRWLLLNAFAILMTVLAYQLVSRQMQVTQTSAAMKLPMWIVYTPMLMGYILMFIRINQAFFKRKKAEPTEEVSA